MSSTWSGGDQVCGLRGGGCGQIFHGDSIYENATTGSHVIGGAIRDTWASQGYESGALGYPTSDNICGLRNGGCGQLFQGGRIYWSPATGEHDVRGPIGNAWTEQGYEAGRLGYPTSEQIASRLSIRQIYRGGTITYDVASGRTSISTNR